jgi:hypothetical protein
MKVHQVCMNFTKVHRVWMKVHQVCMKKRRVADVIDQLVAAVAEAFMVGISVRFLEEAGDHGHRWLECEPPVSERGVRRAACAQRPEPREAADPPPPAVRHVG